MQRATKAGPRLCAAGVGTVGGDLRRRASTQARAGLGEASPVAHPHGETRTPNPPPGWHRGPGRPRAAVVAGCAHSGLLGASAPLADTPRRRGPPVPSGPGPSAARCPPSRGAPPRLLPAVPSRRADGAQQPAVRRRAPRELLSAPPVRPERASAPPRAPPEVPPRAVSQRGWHAAGRGLLGGRGVRTVPTRTSTARRLLQRGSPGATSGRRQRGARRAGRECGCAGLGGTPPATGRRSASEGG